MLPYVIAWLSRFDREEEGQGLVEYALIIVLVSILCIAALTTLSDSLNDVFGRISDTLTGGGA
jgi:pilus assembly protein Flp/PilA